MAKKGYFAGDVALVSDKFAAEHPDLVKAWVKQNLRAVDWVNGNKPGAYDAMMKEYELTPDQFKQAALPPATAFPTREDQLSDQWFGNGAKGIIASSVRIGEFLKANKLITTAPTEEQLTQRTDASFLEKAKVPPAQ
jgi:ABC-type nitrate/sulfonate/bicarbonate transport system substrate-binding protein